MKPVDIADFHRTLYSADTLAKTNLATAEPGSQVTATMDPGDIPANVLDAANTLLEYMGVANDRWLLVQFATKRVGNGVVVKALVVEPPHPTTAATLERL